jgi:hypothetical protein
MALSALGLPLCAHRLHPRIRGASRRLFTYFDGDLCDRQTIRLTLLGDVKARRLHVRVARSEHVAVSSFRATAPFTHAALDASDMEKAFRLAQELHQGLGQARPKGRTRLHTSGAA